MHSEPFACLEQTCKSLFKGLFAMFETCLLLMIQCGHSHFTPWNIGGLRAFDAITTDWGPASEGKNWLSCLWHFPHLLSVNQCFQEMPSVMILSWPAYLVPTDKCYITYMGRDSPTYPQCPAHVLGICSKERHFALIQRHPGQKQVHGMFLISSKWTHSEWDKGVEDTCMRISSLSGSIAPESVSTKIPGILPGIWGSNLNFPWSGR